MMRVYMQEDCVQQNLPEYMTNCVIVLPENEMGQLFFCMGDNGDLNFCRIMPSFNSHRFVQ